MSIVSSKSCANFMPTVSSCLVSTFLPKVSSMFCVHFHGNSVFNFLCQFYAHSVFNVLCPLSCWLNCAFPPRTKPHIILSKPPLCICMFGSCIWKRPRATVGVWVIYINETKGSRFLGHAYEWGQGEQKVLCHVYKSDRGRENVFGSCLKMRPRTAEGVLAMHMCETKGNRRFYVMYINET